MRRKLIVDTRGREREEVEEDRRIGWKNHAEAHSLISSPITTSTTKARRMENAADGFSVRFDAPAHDRWCRAQIERHPV